MRLAEGLSARPPISLSTADVGSLDQLKAMIAWNRSGRLPEQNGFARPLPSVVSVRLDKAVWEDAHFQSFEGGYVARDPQDRLVWGTGVEVPGAYGLRLGLARVDLPPGARMWVWGLGEAPKEFEPTLTASNGLLWTPTIGGDNLYFELAIPASALQADQSFSFRVTSVAELFQLNSSGSPAGATSLYSAIAGSCLVDEPCVSASTYPEIDSSKSAMAQLQYIDGANAYICSGGLLNSTNPSKPLYLLTAHHCISTQSAASTLVATWDYIDGSCEGGMPNFSSLPESVGSVLIATGAQSDFTLLQLASVPPRRTLLGWSASQVPGGTTLHRLSFPYPNGYALPLPETYSQTAVDASAPTCAGWPHGDRIYELPAIGGTYGGSSGSPVMLSNGQVVGQLTGLCGPNPTDGCDYSNHVVDGAFAVSYPALAPYLNPSTPPTGPCVPDDHTLCIDENPGDSRYEVTVDYTSNAGSGQGHAVPLSTIGFKRGGMFWFFDSTNPEMLIKVLHGCGVNNHHWVFFAATTNVGLIVRVTDTQAGVTKVYTNDNLHPALPVTDVTAFNCP